MTADPKQSHASRLVRGESVPPLVMMGVELATLALRPVGTDLRILRTPEALFAELPRLRSASPDEGPSQAPAR
jgi:hypothetical protein